MHLMKTAVGLRSALSLALALPAMAADILHEDGNPLQNIMLITYPEKNFKAIMKDGKIYNYTIQ